MHAEAQSCGGVGGGILPRRTRRERGVFREGEVTIALASVANKIFFRYLFYYLKIYIYIYKKNPLIVPGLNHMNERDQVMSPFLFVFHKFFFLVNFVGQF